MGGVTGPSGAAGGGELQEETQILLHEPLREVPSSWKEAMEADAADHQDGHNHHPGPC